MDHSISSSTHYFTPEIGNSSSIKFKPINIEEPLQETEQINFPKNYNSATPIIESNLTNHDVPTPLARARFCDVYIGHNLLGPLLSHRLLKWLRAELEMLGVSVFTSDRSRNKDAISHCAARVAMDVAPLGIMVITVSSLSNAFSIEEILCFSQRRKLVPIFVGLTRDDCVSVDVIKRKGDLWDRFGGELWVNYGGKKEDWIEAVDGLSRVDIDFEASATNMRDCILDIVAFIGKRLGKRNIIESINRWTESSSHELPLSRNNNFLGRKQELRQLEYVLFGFIGQHDEEKCINLDMEKNEKERRKGKKPLTNEEEEQSTMSFTLADNDCYDRGTVCITGETGIGKTELLLEFAYQHSQKYKAVFWIGGEARFLRENYMKLSGPLGIEVGIDNGSGVNSNIEDEAISKVRKEFTRDIPYLLIIDNLETENDFWDAKPISHLLPTSTGQTHVLISTRLPSICNIMQLKLPYPSYSEAMALIKGENSLFLQDEYDGVLEIIQEKLQRLPFGLVLARSILSQLAIDAQTLMEVLENAMNADVSYTPKEDPVFQYNPCLIQLLDVCFSLFSQFYNGKENLALTMIEASTRFGPSPVPVSMLAYATWGGDSMNSNTSIWKKLRDNMLSLPCMGATNAECKDVEVLSMLMRLGIARSGAQPGHVSFHDIFKLYARKRIIVEPNCLFIEAIIDEGFSPAHSDHAWTACFLVLKFGLYHPIPIDLAPRDFLFFIKQLVTPLVTYSLNELSLCSIVLEILRVTTQRLEILETSLLSEVEASRKSKSLFSGKNRSVVESDPFILRDIAALRAVILETRAKIMTKMGKYDVAEDLCKTVINIKEVIYGMEHVEVQSTRKIMDLIANLKSRC